MGTDTKEGEVHSGCCVTGVQASEMMPNGPEQGSAKGKLGKGKMISGISTGTEKTLELFQTVKQSPANLEFEEARRQLMLSYSRKGDGHWALLPQSYRNKPPLSQETPLSPICWSVLPTQTLPGLQLYLHSFS